MSNYKKNQNQNQSTTGTSLGVIAFWVLTFFFFFGAA